MRDLATLPASPPLTATLGPPQPTDDGFFSHTVTLNVGGGATDAGSWLAFFVRLQALDASGADVLPATWSDNYVTLQAGESVELTLTVEPLGAVASVTAEAFNAGNAGSS